MHDTIPDTAALFSQQEKNLKMGKAVVSYFLVHEIEFKTRNYDHGILQEFLTRSLSQRPTSVIKDSACAFAVCLSLCSCTEDYRPLLYALKQKWLFYISLMLIVK